MTIDIRLPALSPTMSEGVLLRWRKSVGDAIRIGDVIAEIETDKVTVDYESVDAGTLVGRLVDEGATVQVQDVIAVLEAADDISRAPALAENHRSIASPMARRLARELTIDLTRIHGTGPNGRIVKADILAVLPEHRDAAPSLERAPAAVEPTAGVELSSMRRQIAARMQASKQTIPHFYIAQEIRVDKLLALKAEMNDVDGTRVGINDFVLRASALACAEVLEFNVAYVGERLVEYDTVDIGMAIATPRGLVAPVLRDLARKTLRAISAEARLLVSRAKDGALRGDDMHGGGMTVSNLGSYSVEAFTAIINPPQVAILAVGAAQSQPVVDDGSIVVGTVMQVTLSADHRIIDGVAASRWIEHFKQSLEQPLRLLLQ